MSARPRSVAGFLIATVAVLLLTGCVGPATTIAAYNGKAVHAADAALSEVATVQLSVHTALKGRLQQNYLETVLSAAEESMSSIQGTFDSIQPPDNATADKLRTTLDPLLSASSDAVSQLRIEARRHHTHQLAALLSSLSPLVKKLTAFSTEHGG